MSDQPTKSKSRRANSKASLEHFVKNFEWTWTTAVVFSLAMFFFILVVMVALPSFFMYFVGQKYHWSGPTDISAAANEVFIQHEVIPDILYDWGVRIGNLKAVGLNMNNELRDIVAMTLTTLPFILTLVFAAAMQNWRQKLRGQSGEKRPTGGYR
jgi:hypothetical protein